MRETDTRPSSTNRRRFLKSAAAAGVVAGLAGCVGGGGNGGGGDGSGPIKVGQVTPLSGPYAPLGNGMVESVELAIQDAGEVGGREVEQVTRDSETAASTAVPEANDLIQEENIDVLIGGASSAVDAALRDIAHREEMLFAPMSTGAQVTGENCSKYLFHFSAHSYQCPLAPAVGYDEGLWESFYIMHPDYAGPELNGDAAEDFLSERGATIAGRSSHPLGNDDYSAQISDIQNADPDVVFHIAGGADPRNFVRQANSAGLDRDILINMGNPTQARDVGLDDFGGTYIGTNFTNTTDAEQEFTEAIVDNYGHFPNWWDESAYTTVREFLWAIDQEDGSSDGDALFEQLNGREFNVLKPATWRECNNKALYDMALQRTKTEDEMEDEYDLFETIGTMASEGNMPSCEERGCQL